MYSGAPVEYHPIRWFFGDGYTIFTRLCEWGGNEIHVESSIPVRHICLEIIKSTGGEWWTTISPKNQRAINLCLKCGFKYFTQKTVIDSISGKLVTRNVYRRVKDV